VFYDSLSLKFYPCDIKKIQGCIQVEDQDSDYLKQILTKSSFMIGNAFDGFEFGHRLTLVPTLKGPAFEYYDQNDYKKKYILLSDKPTGIYVSDIRFAEPTSVTPLKMSLDATSVSSNSSDKNKSSWLFYRELDDYGRIKDTRDWPENPTRDMLKNGYPRNCHDTVHDYILKLLTRRSGEGNKDNEAFCRQWYTIGDGNIFYHMPLLVAKIEELLPKGNSFLQQIKMSITQKAGSRKRKQVRKYFKKSKRKSKSKSKSKRRQKKINIT
jgi:hypothetical protein